MWLTLNFLDANVKLPSFKKHSCQTILTAVSLNWRVLENYKIPHLFPFTIFVLCNYKKKIFDEF